MGKVPKMAVFRNFASVINLKTEKNDNVGNLFSKLLAKIFFSKKVILAAL